MSTRLLLSDSISAHSASSRSAAASAYIPSQHTSAFVSIHQHTLLLSNEISAHWACGRSAAASPIYRSARREHIGDIRMR